MLKKWLGINLVTYIYACFCRYGLPVNFQAMLLQPNKKNMKKLREVLNDLYKHLDSSAAVIDVSFSHGYGLSDEMIVIT